MCKQNVATVKVTADFLESDYSDFLRTVLVFGYSLKTAQQRFSHLTYPICFLGKIICSDATFQKFGCRIQLWDLFLKISAIPAVSRMAWSHCCWVLGPEFNYQKLVKLISLFLYYVVIWHSCEMWMEFHWRWWLLTFERFWFWRRHSSSFLCWKDPCEWAIRIGITVQKRHLGLHTSELQEHTIHPLVGSSVVRLISPCFEDNVKPSETSQE